MGSDKPGKLSDAAALGNRLLVREVTDEPEVIHAPMLPPATLQWTECRLTAFELNGVNPGLGCQANVIGFRRQNGEPDV